MDVDLNEVATFVRVVEAGGFSAAAKELRVPKSTVSRRITRLEERLDARLLQRTTRRMRLTEEGQRYFEQVSRAIGTLHDASVALVEGHDVPRGLLRVTAPVDFGHAYLAELVGRFVRTFPEVRVHVELTNRVVDMVREGFDCAIRGGVLADSTLVARRIGRVNLVPFASPAYLEREGPLERVDDLVTHECVLFRPQGDTQRWRLTRGEEEATVEVRGPISTMDFGFTRRLLLAGAGVGLLPSFAAARDCESGRLRPVLPGWSTQSGSLHLLYPSAQHMPPKLSAFRDFLLAQLDTSRWELRPDSEPPMEAP